MDLISVRDARVGDGPAIADAHTEGWRVAYRGIVDDETLDSAEFRRARHDGWVRRLEQGPPPDGDIRNRIFVVEVARGGVVGFGHVGRSPHPPDDRADTASCGEVYGFYVHPEQWGTGVSDVLMEACLAELASRFDHAVLWTLRDNPRSRGFYERHGWVCGEGEDAEYASWDGPAMPGLPNLNEPLIEIRYRRDLGPDTSSRT